MKTFFVSGLVAMCLLAGPSQAYAAKPYENVEAVEQAQIGDPAPAFYAETACPRVHPAIAPHGIPPLSELATCR